MLCWYSRLPGVLDFFYLRYSQYVWISNNLNRLQHRYLPASKMYNEDSIFIWWCFNDINYRPRFIEERLEQLCLFERCCINHVFSSTNFHSTRSLWCFPRCICISLKSKRKTLFSHKSFFLFITMFVFFLQQLPLLPKIWI